MFLLGSTTDVTSVAGDITITGTGGNGSAYRNYGVFIESIETISSTGTGNDAAKITITGTGGAGTFQNYGVFLLGSTTDVTSVAGDITITGVGGNGSSDSNFGVLIGDIETISSTGTGSDAAKIPSPAPAGRARFSGGVSAHDRRDSVAGDITIIGTGGNGSGQYTGVVIGDIETISSTGTGSEAAKITITGTGGAGTSDNYGVWLIGSTMDVTSAAGDITITGTGGNGSSSGNYGVFIESIETISSTGTGSDAANNTITGTDGQRGQAITTASGCAAARPTERWRGAIGDDYGGPGGKDRADNNHGVLRQGATVQVTGDGHGDGCGGKGGLVGEITGGRVVVDRFGRVK